MKKLIIAIFCMFLLAGCKSNSNIEKKQVSENKIDTENNLNFQDEQIQASIFIGVGDDLKEYIQNFDSEPTPDMLIQAISDKTGWNLSLVESVSVGKGGMTIIFGKNSAIFTGPPEEQKEEFRVYDTTDLVFHILDSIQKTLQMNAVNSKFGDPLNVDIYFATEENKPISLPDLLIDIPIDTPYQGSEFYNINVES